MDVILLEDVDKVGLRGDVVSVARGYMRNYLQPRRLAEEATEARVAELRRRDAERARHEARSAEEAEAIAETLRKTVLSFEVNAGPQGTLFGSVTPTDIVDELWRTRKIRVDRRKVDLDPIKRIGRYEVPIAVFEDVRVEVKTLVKPIGGELPPEEELEAMAAAEAAASAEAEAEAEAASTEVEAALVEAIEAGEPAEETTEVEAAPEPEQQPDDPTPA
jgi:large subunit ribosomal protein L9